ncbi:glycosyltransferase family 2 protein [Agathobaculum sp. Marseille-P7918]|uniref:glycosyltransferase family 2 protein n=1 Tax=Agathobaculum sp. Marseille-P7918 TaxID=2479843 RepID=UPI003565BAD5
MPKITILLPTYQSELYINETLDSIRRQTMKDFEILVVDDSKTDKTRTILSQATDLPIRVLNGRKKGLADALNLGIMQAKGQYIARIDADDLMTPDRLEKQANYLDAHQDVIVCGGWQQYFGKSSYLHAPPADSNQCRANLIFRCDLCHATVMLRRKVFVEHELFYDARYAAEDFELWTRALHYGEIANLPEILCYYRFEGQNITVAKMKQLIEQNGQIAAKTLKRTLNIELSEEQTAYFTGWSNPFYEDKRFVDRGIRRCGFDDLKKILLQIIETNEKVGAYESESLCKALQAEWLRLRYRIGFHIAKGKIDKTKLFQEISAPRCFFLKIQGICANYPGLKRKIIKVYCIVKNKVERKE